MAIILADTSPEAAIHPWVKRHLVPGPFLSLDVIPDHDDDDVHDVVWRLSFFMIMIGNNNNYLLDTMIMKTIIDNNNNNNNNLLLYDHEDEHPEPDKGWQPGSSKSCLKVSIWERS